MLLEKPERASAGVNMLNNIKKMRAHKATMSDLIFPIIKKAVATTNIAKVTYIFGTKEIVSIVLETISEI